MGPGAESHFTLSILFVEPSALAPISSTPPSSRNYAYSAKQESRFYFSLKVCCEGANLPLPIFPIFD